MACSLFGLTFFCITTKNCTHLGDDGKIVNDILSKYKINF